MTETLITCPSCGHQFPVSEALSAQISGEIESRLKSDYELRLRREVERAKAGAEEVLSLQLKDLQAQLREQQEKNRYFLEEQLALRKRTRELEEQNRTVAERVREELEQQLRREADERVQAATAQAEARAREQVSQEVELLQRRLADQQEKVRQAQDAELALRHKAQELEERQRELDLELARKLDAERRRIEDAVRKNVHEEQSLKIKEKEKQIEDLRKALEEAKRRSELGSQELQGEVLELDIQAGLERLFPQDAVEPVPKGVRGADLLQEVRNTALRPCGSIVWEIKNTKHWTPAWVEKLKADQRSVGANLAVIVSVALPEGVEGFGQVDGVWVVGVRTWPALAAALREQLIQVAFAHAASEGKHEKMELLYRYLAGDQFRQRVQGIVEAFTAMQEQLHRERRAMEKQWREREKQIERVTTNTVGMYGEMRGIVGASLPEILALELDPDALLEDQSGA